MNKWILIVLSVFSTHLVLAQENGFRILSSVSYTRNYNINDLPDNKGIITGSFEGYFYVEKPAELFVTYNNQRMEIQKPLGMFIVVPEAERLFNYGEEPGFYTDYNLELHVLKTNGSWIKNVGVIGHSPYAVAASAGGDFYAFAHVDIDSIHSLPYLKKVDKNGNIQWEIRMEDCIPQAVNLSPGGELMAVTYLKEESMSFITDFYDDKGAKLFSLNHTLSVGGIEFISEKQFIVTEENGWKLYSINNGAKPIYSGVLPGKTFSRYPITISADKDYFIVVSLGSGNVYHLSAISLKDGKLISEIEINESPFWEPYRMAVFEGKDKILLRTGKQLVKLQLNR
ncbi:MAG TPA: hypothetical protein P5050_00040 [Bacteroidia bacterium]|nr:hypothetical protein [Bacteroidia bacterium]HRS57588.1 hypothetical protein [Bacteroidia bacterium]HRU67174.1 hypothetical protein [Bacteroidia bacterium]